jgi:hypothetical protein
MATVTSDAAADAMTEVWQRIRLQLESERDRVCREIRDYPTPIPRCDAQFNHLLELRDSLARELRRFDESAAAANAVDATQRMLTLIEQAELGEALKRELRSIAGAGETLPASR